MTSPIPEEISAVWGQYALGTIANIALLPGGLINETYRVTTTDERVYILQKMHRVFDQSLMADVAVIAGYLQKKGWVCPVPINTAGGVSFASLGAEMWRTYRYINGSDFASISPSTRVYFEVGERLGALHTDLSALAYTPLHTISGFHNKDFYIEKATAIEPKRYPEVLQPLLEPVLEHLGEYSQVVSGRQQLIHGDPRIENILFSQAGSPVTFIDFDTFMRASIYIDIGDCLRSLMVLRDRNDHSHRLGEFVSGYALGNPAAGVERGAALSALRYITAELTLRFMIDSVEQRYFAWDPKVYKSARECNRDRALVQWGLLTEIAHIV